MAERIEAFEVTIPSGTTQSAPQTTPLPFQSGIVERVEILIPPGPSGLVGFQLSHSGQTIIPYNSAQFIVADNEVIRWELQGYPTGEAWAIRAYNDDVYDHTLYLRFLISERSVSTVTRAQLVSIAPGGTSEDGS